MTQLERIIESMRLVSEDCTSDATKLDSTPFTPRGIGEALGSMLAQTKACADSIAIIAAELQPETSGSDGEEQKLGR